MIQKQEVVVHKGYNESYIGDIGLKYLTKDLKNAVCIANYVIHNGMQVLRPEDLTLLDTEKQYVEDDVNKMFIAFEKRRDCLFYIEKDNLIFGIEHQTSMDENVITKVGMYDMCDYFLQLHKAKGKKITKVITAVINYEDRPKDISLSLKEMMGPSMETVHDNDWHICPYNAVELDTSKLYADDMYHLFSMLQGIHQLKRDPEGENPLKGMKVPRHIAIIVAKITNNKEFLKMIEITKGSEVEVWESLREFQESARDEGRAEGRAEGEAKGRTEGINEGELRGKAISVYTITKRILDEKNYTLDAALKFLGVSKEDYFKGKALVQD